MEKERFILIMGAGTVGIRDADVLLSLGIPVALCKYDAHPEDIKTRELKRLFEYRGGTRHSRNRYHGAGGQVYRRIVVSDLYEDLERTGD